MKMLFVRAHNGAVYPAMDEDRENIKKIPYGEMFQAEVTQPRNIKFHRKTMVLFKTVFENQEHYKSVKHLRKDITIAAGYYTHYVNYTTGETVYEADSISFAAMDNYEFIDYYNKIIGVIIQHFSWDKEALIQEIEEKFAPKYQSNY